MEVSRADLEKNYRNLNVSFELWKGESDAQKYIPGLIQDLKDKGLACESQGALVVDIREPEDTKELPPCIVQKSDGAALYATSDLGTVIEREKDFAPDAYIYIADKRQDLHYTQFFRVARKAGFVREGIPMSFLGFGTMNGKDGKPFKTRDGGVMRLEQLIAEINEAAYRRIMENRTMEEEDARNTAKLVGLAAASPAEKALMLEISRYNEVMENSFAERAPHKICQYIYDLSEDFNHFYQDVIILTEEDKNRQGSFIRLIDLARDVLNACIHVLGFEAPERM